MRIRRGRPKGVPQVAGRLITSPANLILKKKLSHYAFPLNATAFLFIFFNLSVSYADSSPIKGATDNP